MRKPHLGPGRFSEAPFSGEMAAGFAERLGMIPLGSQPKQQKREQPPPPDPAPVERAESEERADGDGSDGGALESGEVEEDMELYADHGADDELEEEEDVELGADHGSDDELEEEEDANRCAAERTGVVTRSRSRSRDGLDSRDGLEDGSEDERPREATSSRAVSKVNFAGLGAQALDSILPLGSKRTRKPVNRDEREPAPPAAARRAKAERPPAPPMQYARPPVPPPAARRNGAGPGADAARRSKRERPTPTPKVDAAGGGWTPTAEQLAILEKNFSTFGVTKGKKKILQLVDELAEFGDVTEKNIYNWFQTKRDRGGRPHRPRAKAEAEAPAAAAPPPRRRAEAAAGVGPCPAARDRSPAGRDADPDAPCSTVLDRKRRLIEDAELQQLLILRGDLEGRRPDESAEDSRDCRFITYALRFNFLSNRAVRDSGIVPTIVRLRDNVEQAGVVENVRFLLAEVPSYRQEYLRQVRAGNLAGEGDEGDADA